LNPPGVTNPPVARSIVLLGLALTCLSGMLQLAVAVATVTLVLVTGVEGILGLAPAIFLGASAVAALPAGRAMDRFGRIPVLATGYLAGTAGCALSALGCHWEQTALVILGLGLIGGAMGISLLGRAAAADLVAPERRPRVISLVLFGAVAGAVHGPFVFGPLFADRHLETADLVVPWLAAGAFMVGGLLLVLAVRPDPKVVAARYARAEAESPPAPLAEILRRPGVRRSLVAAVASFGVMTSVMNLTGYVMIGHGHQQADVFPVISAHIVGMYGLVLVVGDLIQRLGRRHALVGGLLLMGVSTLSLTWVESQVGMGIALSGLGLGWCFSYVAATTELVDRASASERGRLVGFGDLVSAGTGASLSLLGGVGYSELGVASIGIGGTIGVVLPALLLAAAARRPPAAALEPASGD
jgi:MFS family permease